MGRTLSPRGAWHEPDRAGNVLFAAVIAYQVGMLAFGPLDRVFDTRKWIAFGGTVALIVVFVLLAVAPNLPTSLAIAFTLIIGFFSASSTMALAHGRGVVPDRLIGRGMATINTCVMLGVACMQTISGIVIGAFTPLAGGGRTEIAYRALFTVLAIVLTIALALYSRSHDVKPSDLMRESGH